MDQGGDPRDLERKIEQSSPIASSERPDDSSAPDRAGRRVDTESEKRRAARRSKEESERAHELWEQHGRPVGRDEEFWLRAELEIRKSR